jgi:small-conductance mechanosensitive channel
MGYLIWNPEIGPGSIVTVLTGICVLFGAWYAMRTQLAVIIAEAKLRQENASGKFASVNSRIDRVDSKVDKVDGKLDVATLAITQIAVQDERLKAFDLRLADLNDQIKELTMARHWPRPPPSHHLPE